MTTITEDYVSFETAKLLKEKGFEERVMHYYFTQITHVGFKDYPTGVLYTDSYPQNQNNYNNKVAAPTLQMAMKWLREMHDRNIIFNMIPEGNDCYVLWTFNILSNKNYKIIWGTKQPKYNTYEEACEAAIKYCLENLI